MSKFMENSDGVHLMHPYGEHTICGDAVDIGSEPGMDSMKPTSECVVTCERCKEVIETCQDVECE